MINWLVDTLPMFTSLPHSLLYKAQTFLALFPPYKRRTSMRHWHDLLLIIHSRFSIILGCKGLFYHLQSALWCPGRIRLTPPVRKKLNKWLHLIEYLIMRPTHMLEVVLTNPAWFGVTGTSAALLGRVFCGPNSIPYV